MNVQNYYQIIKQKLESIALVKSSKNSIKLVGVCDNDDGATGLVEIEVMI